MTSSLIHVCPHAEFHESTLMIYVPKYVLHTKPHTIKLLWLHTFMIFPLCWLHMYPLLFLEYNRIIILVSFCVSEDRNWDNFLNSYHTPICVHKYTYMNIFTYMHMYVCMYVCMYMCMCAYIHTYLCTCMYVRTCICMYVSRVCVHNACVYAYACYWVESQVTPYKSFEKCKWIKAGQTTNYMYYIIC